MIGREGEGAIDGRFIMNDSFRSRKTCNNKKTRFKQEQI